MTPLAKKSPFKMGWLLVMFDLPVLTKGQRKTASDFRDALRDDGFFMVQFSVYARACADLDRMEKHRERVKSLVPDAGNVRLLFLTDCQWTKGECIIGKDYDQGHRQLDLEIPAQAEFW